MTFAVVKIAKKQQNYSCNWFIAPISMAKMGTVAIGIGIGTCIGLRIGSVETVLHITIEANSIGIGIGIGVGQWKHTITELML